MFRPMDGLPGIIGYIHINANGIYPPNAWDFKDISIEGYISPVVQDIPYPADFAFLGKIDGTIIAHVISIKSLSQYRYVRDEISQYVQRYAKFGLARSFDHTKVTYYDFISPEIIDMIDSFVPKDDG